MSQFTQCRCPWLDTTKSDYVNYHDTEWGVPIFDDQQLFECLTLETAQAGLSWYTILKKREGYRKCFAHFDVLKVSTFTAEDESRLVLDNSIIRHKGKISATINNAKHFIDIQNEFGSFSEYLWGSVNHVVQVSQINHIADYPTHSAVSDRLSKDLKKRGFKFVGTKTMYAFLQAVGVINDHSSNCYRKQELINYYAKNKITWNNA